MQKDFIKILKNDGVGIMLTDTIYGFVGSSFSKKAISRIYKIKGRDKGKKLINLISDIKDIKKFGIDYRPYEKILKKYWPGKVTIIIKGTSFRLPKKKSLINILKKTGPLVAPSANPQGFLPAENITEAKKYFGEKVDFYLKGTKPNKKPSKIIKILENGKIEVLRK